LGRFLAFPDARRFVAVGADEDVVPYLSFSETLKSLLQWVRAFSITAEGAVSIMTALPFEPNPTFFRDVPPL
jgi:hypothetical protein